MMEIERPKIAVEESEDKSYAKVIVEPLEKGFGLTLGNARLCGIVTFVSDKWGTEYMHIFHTTDFSGEIIECDEGELCWVDKKEIYNLPIWEGDKIFLRLLEQDVPFFSLKLEYQGDTLVNAMLNGKKQEVK